MSIYLVFTESNENVKYCVQLVPQREREREREKEREHINEDQQHMAHAYIQMRLSIFLSSQHAISSVAEATQIT